MTSRIHPFHFIWKIIQLILVLIIITMAPLSAGELILRRMVATTVKKNVVTKPDQLPQSRVSVGANSIRYAWLADPTDRYHHGVLGDNLEAGALFVETTAGKTLGFHLAKNRVFEDLIPRLVDLNGDGLEEIILVESDINLGASLTIYKIKKNNITKLAATEFLGQPYRWLNPLGAGDFNGDGQLEIAIVVTPHIGGILRLYALEKSRLVLFAEYPGVSTHRIGTTDLGLGRVVKSESADSILLPTQKMDRFILLTWEQRKLKKIAEIELPDTLVSSLNPVGHNQWRFKIASQEEYVIQVK